MSRTTTDTPKPEPHPDDWGPREFSTTGFSAYRLTVPRAYVTFDLSRLRREREELIGELVVKVQMAGARTVDGILSSGDFNLSSIQARSTRAKHLASRSLTQDIDWEGWLTELVLRVIQAERTGQPEQVLGELEPSAVSAEHECLGVTVPVTEPAILFGDGGSAKSFFALNLAGQLARQGQIVMYCDWESDGGSQRARLGQLFGSDLPPILYLRCERPLVAEIDRLRAITLDRGVTYCVLDSAAFGCHGAPEAAEAAIGYFRALRTLGSIGSLILAHVTKADDGDKRPFGSGFWHNSARSTWHVRRTKPNDDGSEVELLFSQRKCNEGRLRAPHALLASFSQARMGFSHTSASDIPEFSTSLTTLQRIYGAIKRRPLDIEAITAEMMDQKPDTVRRVVRRGLERGIFTRLQVVGGKEVIGLKVGTHD